MKMLFANNMYSLYPWRAVAFLSGSIKCKMCFRFIYIFTLDLVVSDSE